MSDQGKTVYLVDGTAQLFRAYFAIRGLSNRDGLPTNAVYGFTNMLRKLIEDERPTFLAVAFDLPGDTFRHDRFPEYKANRPETPEDLNAQVPYARRACEVLDVPVFELERFEADDLIATLARQARERGFEVVVVASDKDLLQLVGEGVRVLNPTRNETLDAQGVRRVFGVGPEYVRDVLGLMGDSVDNIPGVPGVGEKTAKKMVAAYGHLDAIISRAAVFAAAIDARDRFLERLADAAAQKTVGEDCAKRLSAAGSELRHALEGLAEIEADTELRERFRDAATALDDGAFPAAGSSGRETARALREVKRDLKKLERKADKRAWLAVSEHAEQARMSKEVATLHSEAPVRFSPDRLRLGSPDRAAAHALFRSLGFRGLTKAFAPADSGGEHEAGASSAPREQPGTVTTVRGTYVAVTDENGLAEWVRRCHEAGRFAVDTETDRVDPMQARLVGVALCCVPGEGAYVPVGHDYLGAPEQLDLQTVQRHLAPLLADETIAKVGQNFKYDSHVLRRHGMPVNGWALDTMVGAFLLESGRGSYKMDVLAKDYLGYDTVTFEEIAGKGAKQLSLNQVPVETVTGYAAEDADVTLRLAAVIEPRLRSAGLWELYETVDGPLLPMLCRMEAHGVRVDVERLGRMSEEMVVQLNAARGEIHQLAGIEFNVDSPKQVREVLFDRLGLKPRRKTAKSRVASTDAATLEELAERNEIAKRLLEYRELSKLKSTYIDSLPKMVHPETGRVHTSFHPTGAATGRLSSSDPNLQNIPIRTEAGRRIREAFVPDPGWTFLAADYSQIELRVLAHLCEDPELIDAFRRGEDIHRHTAALVAGVPKGLVSDDMRRRAKAVNFGILYGMSAGRLAREQGMTREEASEFIDAYFARFEAVRRYIDTIREQARRDGSVRTLFGRVRQFPQLRQSVHRGIQEQALRAAVNTTIQGTAADLMKMAMLRVERALVDAGSSARILLQVHDELMLEVPEGEIDVARETVRAAMENVHPLRVPLLVDQSVGANWAEVK